MPIVMVASAKVKNACLNKAKIDAQKLIKDLRGIRSQIFPTSLRTKQSAMRC